jgi:hypothetical protein
VVDFFFVYFVAFMAVVVKGIVMNRAVLVLVLLLAATSRAAGQDVQTDPLQCWWRTSAGAIRIGEPFSVVLTCAVLETDAATVVVDQSRLEPSVVQFAPFEVLGGSHGADLRTDLRRFFQYEYRLRLIAESMFGKDAALPETKISYRVQSKVGQKTAIQGRDQTYMLPPQSVRVMSLVPADASDIRDTSTETFSDIDQRAFRANLFTVVGGILFVVAALLALLALVRLFRRYRTPATAAERPITDGAILRGVGRELAAVRRERESGGWTPELAGRALAALRIAATYALGRRVGYVDLGPITNPQSPLRNPQFEDPGRLALTAGWFKGKPIAVSGAVTARSVAHEQARGAANAKRAAMLESLAQALSALTVAQYGRGDVALDQGALDQALATAFQILKRMRLEQTWIMKRLAMRRGGAAPVDTRAWSR